MIKIKNLESLTAFLTKHADEPAECVSIAEVHDVKRTTLLWPQDHVDIRYCTQSGKVGEISFVPEDPDLKEWIDFQRMRDLWV